jgi:hypothetical protein
MTLNTITVVSLAVAGAILLLVFGIFFVRDNFDITVDPLRAKKYEYDTTNLSPYPVAKRNGLNTESNNDVSICSFNRKFNKDTKFVENENMDPCAVTARQYCSVLYSHHQEMFTNLYSGLGECEKVETERCRECPNALNINKERDVYYTQLNRGV